MLPSAKPKYGQKNLKKGQKSWVWVNEVKKNENKNVVRCLSWEQIKVADSLNHLKLFKNHKRLICEKGLF